MRNRSVLASMASLAFAGMSFRDTSKDGKQLPNLDETPKPGKPFTKIKREARPVARKTTRSKWHGKKQPPTKYAETRQQQRFLARQSAKYGVPKSKRRPPYPGR